MYIIGIECCLRDCNVTVRHLLEQLAYLILAHLSHGLKHACQTAVLNSQFHISQISHYEELVPILHSV